MNIQLRRRFSIVLFMGVLSSTMTATAHEKPWSAQWSTAFSTLPREDDFKVVTIAPSLSLHYQFKNGIRMGGDWGFSWISVDSMVTGSSNSVDPGNVMFDVSISRQISSKLAGFLGLRLGAPLALYYSDNLTKKRLTELAMTQATSANGWRDPFLWSMNVIPLSLMAGVHFAILPWLEANARCAPTGLVSLNSRPSAFALSSWIDLRWQMSRLGGYIGWSGFLSTLPLENNDMDQHSLGIGFDLKLSSMTLHLGTALNLDGPNGLTTKTPKPSWGLTLGATHAF